MNLPTNYKPIMYLSKMWKILTAQIRDEIYYSPVSCRLFLEKQKGCYKVRRGTGDLLYIDPHILKESKMMQKNVTMAWIDY